MNVSMQNIGNGLFHGAGGGLKSTQQKMERQQKCASQVDFFEKQKENLKNMKCSSLEEIARKLEMFHSYEDQIAVAKKQYNDSQIMHVLDEARERGGQIAEAAEKTAPKTPEERRKDMAEEAAGTEENKGLLDEMMEEMQEMLEEVTEEVLESTMEELEENAKEKLEEDAAENLLEKTPEQLRQEKLEKQAELKQQEALEEQAELEKQTALEEQEARIEQARMRNAAVFKSEDMEEMQYRHIDCRT